MDQGPQCLWLGPKFPANIAQVYSPPYELEKACKAGYFSSFCIFRLVKKSLFLRCVYFRYILLCLFVLVCNVCDFTGACLLFYKVAIGTQILNQK